ncbi:MAG: Ig-like domain-containing protein, partial [Gemmatimonadota bacterium]
MRTEIEVDPDAETWELPLSVPVPPHVTEIYVLAELISTEGETPTVEWSGRGGPYLPTASNQRRIAALVLFRGPPANLDVKSVRVEPTELAFEEGQERTLSAQVEGPAGIVPFWGTLDPDVATVDGDGTVRGLLPGEARIVVEVGAHSATAIVTVLQRVAEIRTDVAAVEADALGAEIRIGAEPVDPRGALVSGRSLTWVVSPAGLLESTGEGTFRTLAVGEGEVVIGVAGTPDVEARVPVRVTQKPVRLEITPAEFRFGYLGQRLHGTVAAWDRNDHSISHVQAAWSTSAPGVVAMQEPGIFEAVADGEALITARVDQVEVSAPAVVARTAAAVQVLPDATTLTFLGAEQTLVAVAVDAGGAELPGTAVEWSVTDGAVLALEADGASAVVRALAAGNTTVMARHGEALGTAGVTVLPVATAIEVVQAAGPTGRVGEPVQPAPVVRVVDSGGSPVADVAVTLRILQGGGSVDPSTVSTQQDGQVGPATWVLGETPGTHILEISADGLEPVLFEVEAAAGAPAELVLVTGGGQSAPAGSPVPVVPVVRVADGFGNLLEGVDVEFTVAGGGGTVTPPLATTDADGIAAVQEWILGSTPGTNTLHARVGDLDVLSILAEGVGTQFPWLALGRDADAWEDGPHYSADGVTWTAAATFTTAEYWQRLIHGGGRWLALSGSNFIFVSEDGLAWTRVTLPTSENLFDAAWNGDRFVVVGRDGTILVSTDGLVWQTVASGTTENLSGVAWNGAQWLVVGRETLRVSEDALTWLELDTPAPRAMEHLTWNGTVWISPSFDGLWVSPDGADWQHRSLGGDNPVALAWTGDTWVATTWDGTIWVSTDPDGAQWTREYAGTEQVFWYSSVASDGQRTFAVGYTDVGSTIEPLFLERVNGAWEARDAGPWDWLLPVATSTPVPVNPAPLARILSPASETTLEEGQTVTLSGEGWDPQSQSFLPDASLTWYSDLDGRLGTGATFVTSELAFGIHRITLVVEEPDGATHSASIHLVIDGPTQWVAVGRDAANDLRIFTSPDGVDWMPRVTPGQPSAAARIWWTGAEWIVGGTSSAGGWFFRSADGRTWDSVPTSGLYTLSDLGWNGGQWVAVSSAEREIFTSADLATWTLRRDGGSLRPFTPAWNGQQWLLAGSNQGDLVRSTDGAAWETFSSGAPATHYRAGWTGARWILTGNSFDPFYSSADGTIWEAMPGAPGYPARDLLCGGSQCVVVGDAGAVHYTTDGVSWTAGTSGTGAHLQAVGWDGTAWLAGSSSTTVIRSADGATWTPVEPGYRTFSRLFRISGKHLDVPNRAPEVALTAPADRAVFAEAAAITFQGSAVDPEDGPLSGAALEWRSNRDGVIGTGTSVLSTLSRGIHNVQLRAQDGNGAAAAEKVTVRTGLDSWIVVGTYNREMAWSAAAADPTTWTVYSSRFSTAPVDGQIPHAVAYGDDAIIGVSTRGEIFSSPGGLEWARVGRPVTTPLNAVAWNGDHWVIVGNAGTILHSPDGQNWTLVNSAGNHLRDVAWNGSYWVVVGFNGAVLTSPEGITWTA